MGRIDQSTIDTSFVPERHPGAQARWAIQIGTIDSLKWRGNHKIANFLGRNSIEHSFTRLAQVWCDENDNILKDPDTGAPYPPICVRGELNPGAMDADTGEWSGLRVDPHTVHDVFSAFVPKRMIDAFNRLAFGEEADQYKKCKLGVFSSYGDVPYPFAADYVVEKPAFIGGEDAAEAVWSVYQQRAIEINRQGLDYDLVRRNCHTVNGTLNARDEEAVRSFAQRGFMRWGALAKTIQLSSDMSPVISSLDSLRQRNFSLADAVEASRVDMLQSARHADQQAVYDLEGRPDDKEGPVAAFQNIAL